LPGRSFSPGVEHKARCASKAVFDLCYNGTSCSASQAPSSRHFKSAHHPQVPRSLRETWLPTLPDFRTRHLRYSRALFFCPQHWLQCHMVCISSSSSSSRSGTKSSCRASRASRAHTHKCFRRRLCVRLKRLDAPVTVGSLGHLLSGQ